VAYDVGGNSNLDFTKKWLKAYYRRWKSERYSNLSWNRETKSVVLTNGTFLNGKIHIGEKQFGGGRAGESAAYGITEDLINAGFESGRMKQGLKSGWTFFGFSKMNEEKEMPDQISFLIRIHNTLGSSEILPYDLYIFGCS
jgi:tRNA uridine 5-carboxymethylaminomethyl modification enzyme